MAKEEIIATPFNWNDNLAEIAQEDFSVISPQLNYCVCQSIGMALAKLELLEKQGCKVKKPRKYEIKAVTRGNCMLCGKKLTEGLLFCRECEAKVKREGKA